MYWLKYFGAIPHSCVEPENLASPITYDLEGRRLGIDPHTVHAQSENSSCLMLTMIETDLASGILLNLP